MMRIEKIITLSFLLLTLNSYGMQKIRYFFKPVAKANEMLFNASEQGDLKALKSALDAGADVNAKNNINTTPLLLAALNGKLEVVKELIEHGANVNAKDSDNRTPLHWVAQPGKLDIVKELLEHGADVNAKDSFERTPLHTAAKYRHLEVVKELTKHGADVNAKDDRNKTPLLLAAMFGNLEVVKELIKHGADVNAKDSDNRTPLSRAAYNEYSVVNEYSEVVKELIEHGAQIDESKIGLVKNYFKDEPLLLAAALGDIGQLKQLIGLRPNSDDLTEALIYASAQKQKDAVLLLSQAGANVLPAITRLKAILSRPFLTPEDRDTYKQILNQLVISLPLTQQIAIRPELQTVLAAGAYTLPEEIRESLIPSTQLIAAVKNGDVKRLKELLEKGINPNDVKDENGNSLLTIAVKHNDVTTAREMVRLLLHHQAYPNPASAHGQSLLQVLCSSGDTYRRNIARMLLAAVHNRGIGIPIDLDHQCKQFITKTAASGIEYLTSITNK
ncbi:MAG TPA: ankyrin repeat domain-containing protein, partial [Candidatus Babeliaceae bacterium]|nr:ankyrin repeat domain-containing protein [Candidatus Babeliaceae bacterium]